MPNHWHIVLHPKRDGDLAKYIGWLSNTHTKRWHASKQTTGQGHLYQGRYKSFLCQDDNHFLTLVRYVECNARKANLVKRAENWKWSSVWRREKGTTKQKELLSPWPVTRPKDYLRWLHEPQLEEEEEAIERTFSVLPLVDEAFKNETIEKINSLDASILALENSVALVDSKMNDKDATVDEFGMGNNGQF